MKWLVHIPRPDQSFHCYFALMAAASLAERNHSVVITICDLKGLYCTVRHQKSIDDQFDCSSCEFFLENIKKLYHTVSQLPTLVKAKFDLVVLKKDLLDSNLINQIKQNAIQQYEDFIDYVTSSSYTQQSFSEHLFPWVSESCSITGHTIIDLSNGHSKAECINQAFLWLIHKELAKILDSTHHFDKLLVYNGRFASAKGFYSHFREKSKDCYVHELSPGIDRFLLLRNYSVEYVNHVPYPINTLGSSTNSTGSFLEYLLPVVGGSKGYYISTASKISASQTSLPSSTLNNKSVLIALSSTDEVTTPCPLYTTGYEQTFVTELITALSIQGFDISVRLHPRSIAQFKASRLIEGEYFKFYKSIRDLPNVTVFTPEDSTSSYQLLKSHSIVVSLFSIFAVEAQALGRVSIVHSRSRGASAAALCLTSDDPSTAVQEALEYLSQNSSLYSQDLIKVLKTKAQNLLALQLDNAFKVNCFTGISPYISEAWYHRISNLSPHFNFSSEMTGFINCLHRYGELV